MWGEHLVVSLLNRAWRRRVAHRLDLTLGRMDDTSFTVPLPFRQRAEHVVVVGKTGTGKTTLLKNLARQHFEQPLGFVFFDFHGDATDDLLALAADHPAQSRIVLVDPTDRLRSPGLNPLAPSSDSDTFALASDLASILRRRWRVESFGARTEELMRNVLYTLATRRLTLLEAPALLTSARLRRRLTRGLSAPSISQYWQERYEPLSEGMKASFREPLLNKITGFLTEPCCRHLLGQTASTVDFRRAMDSGQMILINLSKGRLGEHAHTLANLIFAKLQFDVLARADMAAEKRRLFTIFCDEVQNIAENDASTIIAEGRKFAVSLISAHQYWEQLPLPMRGALNAAGAKVFFRLSAADASALAAEISIAARHRYTQELTELPRGQAISKTGSSEPARIRIAAIRPTASPLRIRQFRGDALMKHSRMRQEVEKDIENRLVGLLPPSSLTMPTHDLTEGQTDWQ